MVERTGNVDAFRMVAGVLWALLLVGAIVCLVVLLNANETHTWFANNSMPGSYLVSDRYGPYWWLTALGTIYFWMLAATLIALARNSSLWMGIGMLFLLATCIYAAVSMFSCVMWRTNCNGPERRNPCNSVHWCCVYGSNAGSQCNFNMCPGDVSSSDQLKPDEMFMAFFLVSIIMFVLLLLQLGVFLYIVFGESIRVAEQQGRRIGGSNVPVAARIGGLLQRVGDHASRWFWGASRRPKVE